MGKKKEAVKRKIYLNSSRYDLIRYNWKSVSFALVLVLASLGALFALDGGSITGLTAKDFGGCLAVDLTDGKEQAINIQSGVLNNLMAGENTAKFKLLQNKGSYDFYLYPTDETLAKETIKSGETKQFYFSSVCGGEADLSVKIIAKGFVGRAFGGKDQAVLKWLKKGEAPVQICGNGKVEEEVEPWEECDDGNKLDNDGCSVTCMLEPATEEGEWDCVSPENEPTQCAWVPVELPAEIHPETPVVVGGILIDLSDGRLHVVNVSDEAGNVLIRIGPTDYRFVVDVISATRANINIYRGEKAVFSKKDISFKKAEYADLNADTKNDLYMMINNGKDKGLAEVQLRWEKPKEEAVLEEETGEEQITIWDISETDKEGELDDAVGEIKFWLGGKTYILKVDVSGTSCLNNAMSIYLDNTSNLIAVNKALVIVKQFDLDKDGVNDLKVEIKSCKDHGKVSVVLSWLNKPVPEETISVIDLSDGEKQEIEIDDDGKVKIKIGDEEYELQIDGSAELGAVEKTCVTTKLSVLAEGVEITSQSGSKMTKEFDLDGDKINDLLVEIISCEDKGKIKVNLQWINMPVEEAAEEIIEPAIKVSVPLEIIPAKVGKEVVFNASVEFLGGEAVNPLTLTFVADVNKMEITAKKVFDESEKVVQEFHWLPKKTGSYIVEVVGSYGEDIFDKAMVTIDVTGAKHQFSGYVTTSKGGQNVFVQTADLLFEMPITVNKTYGKEAEFAVYGMNGTILMFFVNDTWILNYTLSDGQVTELNLTVPSTVTTTGGETQPAPAPSGSPPGGSGGSPGYGPSKETTFGEIPSICYYQWSCTEWSSCFGGEQTRTCTRTDECDAFLEANPDLTVIAYPTDAESKKCAIATKKETAPKTPTQPKITLETAAPEIGEPASTEKKKSSLGLILSLVAGALLLAAAGVLIWWKMKPKGPSAMAYPPLKR